MNDATKKVAIVTGGTGFIGSWLVDELLQNNYTVIAIVRDKNRLLDKFLLSENFIAIQSSISDIKPDQIMKYGDIDVFFHLAWGGVAPENKNDVNLQLRNIELATQAIELAAAVKCKKFIASGTVAEYVFSKDVMDVYDKQTPNDMYGAAKVSTHYFLDVLSNKLNQPFIWIVIPSTFGERRLDNNIITYTIRTLLRGDKPKYGELKQMWDFLYVAEVVRAIRLIGEFGKPGRIYGIGSGIYKPLREYIERIRDLIDPSLPLGIGEYPAMSKQTFSSCVNISQLTADTGFVPKVSFDEGIRNTINYWKENN